MPAPDRKYKEFTPEMLVSSLENGAKLIVTGSESGSEERQRLVQDFKQEILLRLKEAAGFAGEKKKLEQEISQKNHRINTLEQEVQELSGNCVCGAAK